MTIGPIGIGSTSEMGTLGGSPEPESPPPSPSIHDAFPDTDEERAERRALLKNLQASNRSSWQQIVNQGAGVDPMAVFEQRIRALTEFLIPEHQPASDRPNPARVEFEIFFERGVEDLLKQAHSELTRAQLAAGPGGGPNGAGGGLWRPGG